MMDRFLQNKIWLLALLFCFVSVFNAEARKSVIKDTVWLKQLSVSENTLNDFRSDSHFKYKTVLVNPNFLDRIIRWLSQFRAFRMIFNISPNIWYGLLIAAFVVLLMVIFRSRLQGIFLAVSNDYSLGLKTSEISEDINLDKLLSEALAAKNYNLAIRYRYLILLKNLNQQKLINYQPGKTNFEYLLEFGKKDLLPQFRELTHDYEYAWYGRFTIDAVTYQEVASGFSQLTSRIYD
jgi:hypothetical protein